MSFFLARLKTNTPVFGAPYSLLVEANTAQEAGEKLPELIRDGYNIIYIKPGAARALIARYEGATR